MPRVGDTRTKILEVAEAEFASEGYAGAHLQKIAEQVGVRKTALYYYFESKAALYTAVVGTILETFDRLRRRRRSRRPRRRRASSKSWSDASTTCSPSIPTTPASCSASSWIRPPGFTASVLPAIARVVERVMGFYRRGVDAGAFRRISTRHFFQSAFGLMLFHYAAPAFSAVILGVDDVFTRPVVVWRRDEVISLLRDGSRPQSAARRNAVTGSARRRSAAARRFASDAARFSNRIVLGAFRKRPESRQCRQCQLTKRRLTRDRPRFDPALEFAAPRPRSSRADRRPCHRHRPTCDEDRCTPDRAPAPRRMRRSPHRSTRCRDRIAPPATRLRRDRRGCG